MAHRKTKLSIIYFRNVSSKPPNQLPIPNTRYQQVSRRCEKGGYVRGRVSRGAIYRNGHAMPPRVDNVRARIVPPVCHRNTAPKWIEGVDRDSRGPMNRQSLDPGTLDRLLQWRAWYKIVLRHVCAKPGHNCNTRMRGMPNLKNEACVGGRETT